MSSDRPPFVVPIGLSANEYYDLGVNYKLCGWIAQSKKALRTAILLDPTGIGKDACTYLRAYLPRHEVPEQAVLENIKAVNQSVTDKIGAEKSLLALTIKYPDFEWPFGNLGHQYIEVGRLEEAKEVLHKALAINPNYANALLHLAAIYMQENNHQEADRYLLEVLKIDPRYKSNILENYPALKDRLHSLAS